MTDRGTKYNCRAKYYKQADGTMRLASIQNFNIPMFRPVGWEANEKKNKCSVIDSPVDKSDDLDFDGPLGAPDDVERATRRARKNAFDIIMCNPDLDIFGTFTYSPDRVEDKANYDECYRYLNTWLSNRVQRNGLKYVCVPERTKAGDIHFHAIMNSSALKLERAFSAKSGRPLTHKGKPLFNISDWGRGFTSAELITRNGEGEDERAIVSKYIFKYMGKQAGQKIGGRYVLIGGEVARPVYLYGDAPSEFLNGEIPIYQPETRIIGDIEYQELGFI